MRVRIEEQPGLETASVLAVHYQMVEMGRDMLDEMVLAAPVQTGRLKESGYFSVDAASKLTIGFDARNEQGEEYAGYVSDGTSRMAGNPFFKNALFRDRDMRGRG